MGAAISLLVILTLSVIVMRVAAVVLRLTGLPDHVARFQARSAFTGTGFTTSETEAVVNYPIRRRVIGLLMVVGNLGLVSVLATVIVSFVSMQDSMAAMSRQLLWLIGAIALLWFIALNPIADRLMCASIGWLLRRVTSLGRQGPTNLLQVSSGYGVAEHRVLPNSGFENIVLSDLRLAEQGLVLLGIRHDDGSYTSSPDLRTRVTAGDSLVLYGSDGQHTALNEEIGRSR